MGVRRSTAIVAAFITAASLIGFTGVATATTASPQTHIQPAEVEGTDTGIGATLAAAEINAKANLNEDYLDCVAPYTFYDTGEATGGAWWYANVKAQCRSSI